MKVAPFEPGLGLKRGFKRVFLPLLAFVLAASLLAACDFLESDEKPALETAHVYVDSAFGYRLSFPEGWEVNEDPDSLGTLNFDFTAFKSGKGFVAGHNFEFDSTESLGDFLADIAPLISDTMILRPMRVVDGVEVHPAFTRYIFEDVGPEPTCHITLYFRRKGRQVTVSFLDDALCSKTNAELRFIDSSLTFF